jgi:organic radical activating enzyme
MATLVRNNFCIAPFTQITFGPAGRYSPCPEIGGRPWKDTDANPIKMWSSDQFHQLRTSFFNNEKNSVCDRCWQHESVGHQSLRKRLFSADTQGGAKFAPGELINFLENQYQAGPKQINLMVGNKCNLRCRVCNAGASVTYNVEGKYYEHKHKLSKTIYTTEKKPIDFSADQIEQIFQMSQNLQRIEFYGGEPLLDIPTLSLLEKFVKSGQSKNIVLFYNTNGTNYPSLTHYALWKDFKSIEFNFSIDDIEKRYTYNRHPGVWEHLVENIDRMKQHQWSTPVQFTAIVTVSTLNIYYLPELLTQLEKMNLHYFLNVIYGVEYYNFVHLAAQIKHSIIEKLKTFHDQTRIQFLITMLEQSQENIDHWNQFKFWTNEKDLYRKENFADTYPEFYKILHNYDNNF